MTVEEYIKKMQELGWPIEYIDKQIDIHNKAKREGIDIPFELDLFEAPINY